MDWIFVHHFTIISGWCHLRTDWDGMIHLVDKARTKSLWNSHLHITSSMASALVRCFIENLFMHDISSWIEFTVLTRLPEYLLLYREFNIQEQTEFCAQVLRVLGTLWYTEQPDGKSSQIITHTPKPCDWAEGWGLVMAAAVTNQWSRSNVAVICIRHFQN